MAKIFTPAINVCDVNDWIIPRRDGQGDQRPDGRPDGAGQDCDRPAGRGQGRQGVLPRVHPRHEVQEVEEMILKEDIVCYYCYRSLKSQPDIY